MGHVPGAGTWDPDDEPEEDEPEDDEPEEEELDEDELDEEELDEDEPDDDELDEDELDDEPEEDELDEDEPDEDEPEDDDPALPPLGDEVSVPVASLSLPPQPSRLTEVANDTPRKTRRLRKKSPVCPAPAKSNASSLETNHITNLPNSLESPDCRPANRLPAPVRRALYPSDIAWADCLQA